MHTAHRTIRLNDTDAAGVIYFASAQRIAHEALEEAFELKGLNLGEVLESGDTVTPVVHAEADYIAPIRLGDKLDIEVRCERVGDTSYVIAYRLLKGGQVVAHAKTVHVAVARSTGAKKPLPDRLRKLLSDL